MDEILFEKEYHDIILKALGLKDREIFKYYENIGNKYFHSNPELFSELTLTVKQWIDWYKTQINQGALEVDEAGHILPDKYQTYIPLIDFGINRSVNIDFFQEHLKIIQLIKKQHFATKTQNILVSIKTNLENYISIDKKDPTGFDCKLHPNIVKEIYNLMKSEKQISGDLEDFQAIFNETPPSLQNPIKWLLKHNNKPNKTALFTFLKMILQLDEVPRELLRQANQYFVFGNEKIFEKTYTYPDIKSQKSSYLKHFKQIKQKYFPDFLKE